MFRVLVRTNKGNRAYTVNADTLSRLRKTNKIVCFLGA